MPRLRVEQYKIFIIWRQLEFQSALRKLLEAERRKFRRLFDDFEYDILRNLSFDDLDDFTLDLNTYSIDKARNQWVVLQRNRKC